ncbi:hypothetical protein Peur_069881 [Populus x canadensis]
MNHSIKKQLCTLLYLFLVAPTTSIVSLMGRKPWLMKISIKSCFPLCLFMANITSNYHPNVFFFVGFNF